MPPSFVRPIKMLVQPRLNDGLELWWSYSGLRFLHEVGC